MKRIKKISRISLAIAALLVLSACAVKPKVITAQERADRIQKDWQAIFKDQEPVKGSLNIYQAMARAVKYNLDVRVKSMESAYAMADAKYANYNMLPSMLATAGYTTRNNDYSILSPTSPNVVSTTEDRDIRQANLQFSWNALDFGVSYLQSKQKADMYLVSQERQRQIIQQVIRDTRSAYWKAWSAQQLLGQVNSFSLQIKDAIAHSQTASNEKLTSAADAAYYRAELWQAYREITDLQNQLMNAKPELLAMINLMPTDHIVLAVPKTQVMGLPKNFPMNSNILASLALHNRPELREEDYKNRISLTEIKKAQLKMLPNLNIVGGGNYNSNSFLVNKEWANFGSQLSWDVLRVFSNYQGAQVAKMDSKVGNLRRMALSMAVVTQVQIAKLRYQQAVIDLAIARHVRDSRYQYFVSIENEQKANLTDKLAVIDAKAKWLVAKLAYFTTYAEWQNASGQLLDSVGYDPLNSVTRIDVPVNVLAKEIRLSMNNIPVVPHEESKRA